MQNNFYAGRLARGCSSRRCVHIWPRKARSPFISKGSRNDISLYPTTTSALLITENISGTAVDRHASGSECCPPSKILTPYTNGILNNDGCSSRKGVKGVTCSSGGCIPRTGRPPHGQTEEEVTPNGCGSNDGRKCNTRGGGVWVVETSTNKYRAILIEQRFSIVSKCFPRKKRVKRGKKEEIFHFLEFVQRAK